MSDFLRGYKVHLIMFLSIAGAVGLFLDGKLTLTELVATIGGALTGSAVRSAWATEAGKIIEALEALANKAKDTKNLFLAACLAMCLVGCAAPEIHDEVTELHKLHNFYRKNVKPLSTLSESDQKKTDELADKIEQSFERLEKLTK